MFPSSLITTLVCRKDKSYCSHFREEETEAGAASGAHPNNPNCSPTSYLCDIRPVPQTREVPISFSENGDKKCSCLLESLHRLKEIMHVKRLAQIW